MSVEICYAPTKKAANITLDALKEHFTAEGLPCTIEPEGSLSWLALDGFESAVLVSIKDGLAVFSPLHLDISSDDPSVAESVERVFQALEWSAEEDADYE